MLQKQTENFFILLGRAALQKRIVALLRKIEHCVNGVHPVRNELEIILKIMRFFFFFINFRFAL